MRRAGAFLDESYNDERGKKYFIEKGRHGIARRAEPMSNLIHTSFIKLTSYVIIMKLTKGE